MLRRLGLCASLLMMLACASTPPSEHEDSGSESGSESEDEGEESTEESGDEDTGEGDGDPGLPETTYCDGLMSGYVLPENPAARGPWPAASSWLP